MKELDYGPAWQVHEGDPTSPVVIHAPHSSPLIPPEVSAKFVLEIGDFLTEMLKMTDHATAQL